MKCKTGSYLLIAIVKPAGSKRFHGLVTSMQITTEQERLLAPSTNSLIGRLDNGSINNHSRDSLDSMAIGTGRLYRRWFNPYIAGYRRNSNISQNNPGTQPGIATLVQERDSSENIQISIRA